MFPLSLYLEQPSCSAELSTKIVQELADPASRTPAADGQQPPPAARWDSRVPMGLGGITGGG